MVDKKTTKEAKDVQPETGDSPVMELLKGMHSTLTKLDARLTKLEHISNGDNPDLEAALNGETAAVVLTPAEKSYYGELADATATEILKKLFRGNGFALFSKAKDGIPMTDFTVFIPEAISGIKRDFRTCPVQNHMAKAELRKFLERVKTQIRRSWVMSGKGEPFASINH